MTDGNMGPADIAAVTNNNGGGWGFGNGEGGWFWIVILFLFAFAGNGWGGGFGNMGGGAQANYVLASDFATIQRQLSDGFGGVEKGLDTIRNGLCDGFYTEAQLINGVNMNIMQGNNALATQLADCCCKTQSGIERVNTQNAMNTATITSAIKDCCCDTEKQFMQTRFDNAQANCATLQAIDKVGDRIIDYLAADKAQALRDENFTLKLAASQANQNNYLVNTLRPCPIPAYQSCNPWAASYGFNNGCGCNGGTWA